VMLVKSHMYEQAMFDKTKSPSIKVLTLYPSKHFAFVALILQRIMANRATCEPMPGETVEKWNEASSVDTRVV
jgi:hypothetical protein